MLEKAGGHGTSDIRVRIDAPTFNELPDRLGLRLDEVTIWIMACHRGSFSPSLAAKPGSCCSAARMA
jgi:hypothetical protein